MGTLFLYVLGRGSPGRGEGGGGGERDGVAGEEGRRLEWAAQAGLEQTLFGNHSTPASLLTSRTQHVSMVGDWW